jgi:hypothetical protein
MVILDPEDACVPYSRTPRILDALCLIIGETGRFGLASIAANLAMWALPGRPVEASREQCRHQTS